MVKPVAVVVVCLVLAACAAGAKKSAMAPPTSSQETGAGAPSPLPGSPRDEIEQLEQKIEMTRVEMKLDEPSADAVAASPATPMGLQPALQDPKCRPAQTDTCKTSCTLSDSICDNANRICELAKSLPNDNWAMNKCAKANTTCEASRTKCCGCQ